MLNRPDMDDAPADSDQACLLSCKRLAPNLFKLLSSAALLLLPLALFAVLFSFRLASESGLTVSVDMQVNNGKHTQLFWTEKDEAFSEAKSTKHRIASGKRKVYRFVVPSQEISSFRFDPSDQPSSARIYSITISGGFISRSWDTTNHFEGWKQIAGISKSNKGEEYWSLEWESADPMVGNKSANVVSHSLDLLIAISVGLSLLCLALYGPIKRKWLAFEQIASERIFNSCLGKHFLKICSSLSEDSLIQFDIKTFVFLVVCFLAFSLMVSLGVHRSSMHLWHDVFGKSSERSEGLLAGRPRHIRSDEWLVATPSILAQLNSEPPLPETNEGLGYGHTPVVFNLPARHLSAFFRPQNYGYFLFDAEQGYAFWWNFKTFGVLVGVFLLLMIITGSNFWLSLFGATWAYSSSFTQWWLSSALPEVVTCFCFATVSFLYLLYSRKYSFIVISAISFAIFSGGFALVLYPPFQIPLVWLGLAIFIAFLLQHPIVIKRDLTFFIRILACLASFGAIVVVILHFFQSTHDTIRTIQETVYPGRRLSTGGQVNFLDYFSGFFDPLLNEQRFPSMRGNICEASSFFFFWPIVALAALFSRPIFRLGPMISALIAYLAGISIFLLWGFPPLLAKITLLTMVPSTRALVGVGLGGIFLVVAWLSKGGKFAKRSLATNTALSTLAIILVAYYANKANIHWDLYYSTAQLIAVGIGVSAVCLALVFQKSFIASFIILSATIIPNWLTNPLAKGLSPIKENRAVKFAHEIVKKDPFAKWLVFDDLIIAGIIKTSGARVLSGVRFIPSLDTLKILDPKLEHSEIYNRYAHVHFSPKLSGPPEFHLIQPDTYSIAVPPCSPELQALEIKYFVFVGEHKELNLSCLEPISAGQLPGNLYVYKRR